MKRLTICVLVLALLASCATKAPLQPEPLAARAGDSLTPVATTLGPVGGYVDGTLKVFLGIPFAQPPISDLRFAPPREPAPWNTPRDATKFGSVPRQGPDKWEPSSFLPQSEDCLTLNVWTPGLDDRRRPVIFYIHGGGFIQGASADPLYDGAAFARRGDVVFVSTNYRHGLWGFLYLDRFGDEFRGSGNLGLQDQIAALKWVRANIERFGGDPSNVTIMGESAGSISVTTLLAVPAAKGLFHKAIAESGAPNIMRTADFAAKTTARLLKVAGVADVAGLRRLTADQLLKAQLSLIDQAGAEADIWFSPVIDGAIVPRDPYEAIVEGAAAGVPLLHGTNTDEYRYWIRYSWLVRFVPPELLLRKAPTAAAKVIPQQKRVIAHYRRANPEASSGDITMMMATDVAFWIPHIRLAEAQSKHAKTWMYSFAWPSPVNGGIYGADHGLELRFVFHNLHEPLATDFVGEHPPEKLADVMNDAWVAFARSGNPQIAGLPEWPSYDLERRATMVFDEACKLTLDPRRAERELYKGVLY